MTPSPTPDPNTFMAWQSLVGTIVGAVLALGGGFGANWLEHRRQRRALRAAFGAEIDAILKISEIRKHEILAEILLNAWKRGQDNVPLMFGSPPQSDPVFANNVDKIGLLGSDASEVVLFYTKLAAVRVHLKVMCEGGLTPMTLPQRIEFVEQALTIWRDTRPKAEELVARLTRSA
jgi:hypothetical protein